MSDFSKMGERIKTLRYKKSMTLGDLANIVGVSKTSISKYENDKATPKAEILEKLALALDTTPAYIMGWEDEQPAHNEKLIKYVNTIIELTKLNKLHWRKQTRNLSSINKNDLTDRLNDILVYNDIKISPNIVTNDDVYVAESKTDNDVIYVFVKIKIEINQPKYTFITSSISQELTNDNNLKIVPILVSLKELYHAIELNVQNISSIALDKYLDISSVLISTPNAPTISLCSLYTGADIETQFSPVTPSI